MSAPAALHGRCACGGVRVALARMPGYVNFCDCTLCRRIGAAWVYDHPDAVTIAGETRTFVRPDLPDPALTVHICPTCGAAIAWTDIAGPGERMGVNARLFEESAFAGLEARFPDGRRRDGDDHPPPRRAPGRVGREVLP